MVRIQREPIETDLLLRDVRSDADGALTLFVGTVRDHNRGRAVRQLEYQAYAEMAEERMARIEAELRQRFEISDVALVHRVGRLAIGEAAVAVAVSAAHRDAAFEACRHAIETLKRDVPIWKREVFDGGEAWIEGAGESPAGPQAKPACSRSSSSIPK